MPHRQIFLSRCKSELISPAQPSPAPMPAPPCHHHLRKQCHHHTVTQATDLRTKDASLSFSHCSVPSSPVSSTSQMALKSVFSPPSPVPLFSCSPGLEHLSRDWTFWHWKLPLLPAPAHCHHKKCLCNPAWLKPFCGAPSLAGEAPSQSGPWSPQVWSLVTLPYPTHLCLCNTRWHAILLTSLLTLILALVSASNAPCLPPILCSKHPPVLQHYKQLIWKPW